MKFFLTLFYFSDFTRLKLVQSKKEEEVEEQRKEEERKLAEGRKVTVKKNNEEDITAAYDIASDQDVLF